MVVGRKAGYSKSHRYPVSACRFCILLLSALIIVVTAWFFWLNLTTIRVFDGIERVKCAPNTSTERPTSLGNAANRTIKAVSPKRWLVFTSVGDNGRADMWTQSPQFDIFASYYGNDEEKLERLRSTFTRVWSAQGAKFPNYYRFRETAEGSTLLKHYSSILICDDDIDLNPLKIHLLFQVRQDLNLSILIPAFHPSGRISWGSSVHVPNSFLRFGTFMEMTCPVFDSGVLERYLTEIYSPTVVGWGVDLLYMWYLDRINLTRDPRKTAVLDVAVITNPVGRRDGKREIDTYFPNREQTWLDFLKERKLEKERFLYRGTPLIYKFYKRNFSRGRMLMDGTLLTEGY